MAAPPAPEPPTLLGYHRILSPTAGVRVSPLCLGTMSFGESWKDRMGECTKETSFAIMDAFYEAGGNFIDTANFYQNEESETWVGDWVSHRGNRDELVLATKYTIGYRGGGGERIKSNFAGNHSKSLRLSLQASLAKLKTDYVDILYVHLWDYTTSVEELMQSLHHVVMQGKVLYLGITAAPAWIVAKCNEYARFHGLTRFSAYQGHWSCAYRDMEREIIPMCEAEGLAILPWGALGRGMFRTSEEYNEADRAGRKMGPQDKTHRVLGQKLAQLAKAKGTTLYCVALAYVLKKAPYVFPVIGGRKVEHVQRNIEALSVELSPEELDDLDSTVPFDVGYPLSFLFETPQQKYRSDMTTRHIWQIATSARLETVSKPQAVESRQSEKQFRSPHQ